MGAVKLICPACNREVFVSQEKLSKNPKCVYCGKLLPEHHPGETQKNYVIEVVESHDVKEIGEIVVLQLCGGFDASNVREFEDAIFNLFEKDVMGIIFDLYDVEYIADTAEGLLIKLVDKFQEAKRAVCFINVPEKLAAFWNMLGLLDIFHISPNKDEALSYCKAKISC